MGQQHAGGGVGAVAGPLVRSSTALRASMVARVDPFEAPEPEPQPFVEAMQQQDAAAAATQGGLVAALRRSISGGGRAAAGRWEVHEGAAVGAGAGRPPRHSVEGTAWAAAAGRRQHQQQQQQQQHQVLSEGGTSMQFLDLDATRAYALGVHQVMMRLEQGMQSLADSEGSSRPTSPTGGVGGGVGFMDAGEDGRAACAAAAETAATGTPPSEMEQGAEQASSQATDDEQQDEDADALEQQLQAQQQQHRSSGREAGGGGVGGSSSQHDGSSTPRSGAAERTTTSSDAPPGMPPLRSGLSSPSASRRQTGLGATPVARQLPLMGQASMEILERPQHHPQQQGRGAASRQTSLVGSSAALSLADVYKQTSGNLAPLSSGMTRRSSRCVYGRGRSSACVASGVFRACT